MKRRSFLSLGIFAAIASFFGLKTAEAKPIGGKKHLSTEILIKVNGKVVGAVQSLDLSGTRDISPGGMPGPTKVTGRVSRIRFDKARVHEAFSRGFVHTQTQCLPLNIEVYDTFEDNKTIVTTVENVWFTNSPGYSYHTEDFIIASEYVDFEAESIKSNLK